jgi:hypothetical protein
MAIEIRQLIVRAVVESRPAAAIPAPTRSTAAAAVGGPSPAAVAGPDRDALIAACVQEVLRELRKGRER